MSNIIWWNIPSVTKSSRVPLKKTMLQNGNASLAKWQLLWGKKGPLMSNVHRTKRKKNKNSCKSNFPCHLINRTKIIKIIEKATEKKSLVQKDSTCHEAARSVSHNYWAHELQLLKPDCLEPVLWTREVTTIRSLSTTTKNNPCSP